MTDNKEKALNQDAELDLEEVGDKIVGGMKYPENKFETHRDSKLRIE